MKNLEELSIGFYEAVIENNGPEVIKILNNKVKIPIRTITGMLVIAIENKAKHSIAAILKHNQQSTNRIPEDYLNALLRFASKEELLNETLITYH